MGRTAVDATAQGLAVVAALSTRPGGGELLELGRDRADLALVGGAVRDLLRGGTPRELDVVVEQGAADFANALASRLDALAGQNPNERFESIYHERFRTALVYWSGGQIDIATRRAESYPRPGALPVVRAGSPAEDLARRDFTINAIAVPLGGPHVGELEAVEHALEDLDAGRLRVLHERSFIDDPTRLLRLARYRARLSFEVEPETARLARSALASGALGTVSGARVGAELWLATKESPPGASFASLGELGVLEALGLPSPFDEQLLRDAYSLKPPDAVGDIVEMAVLFHPAAAPTDAGRERAAELMNGFEFFAETRERVLAAAFDAPALVAGIERAQRPSKLRALLAGRPVEAVVLAAALAGRHSRETQRKAETWLSELRDVQLEIGGADLLAAGLPEGPGIGRRLEYALDLKLDGRLDGAGREAELSAALAASE
jgi:tRNA nucleotidyltransferase (CCA-adding enzyme)